MKKIFLVIFLSILLCFNIQNSQLNFFATNFEGKYVFYTSQILNDENVSVEKSGMGYVLTCSTKYATKIKSKLNINLIKGESFSFLGVKSEVENLIKRFNIKVLNKEVLDEILVIDGYSSKFGKSVCTSCGNVNIQIAFNKGTITVGTPLILGSF